MQKIGVLSDTHSTLSSQVIDFLSDTDIILHAGDIGNLETFEKLEKLKPFYAVYGNIDGIDIRQRVKEFLNIKIEDVNILMTHIGGFPRQYAPKSLNLIRSIKPNIFISGHSHILKIMPDKKNNLLHINPGAAGNSGFHIFITAVKFNIDGSQIKDVFIFEQKRTYSTNQ